MTVCNFTMFSVVPTIEYNMFLHMSRIQFDCVYIDLIFYQRSGVVDGRGLCGILCRICFAGEIMIILLFGRSCVIVGHHRLTDELFPAAAIFCSPYAL